MNWSRRKEVAVTPNLEEEKRKSKMNSRQKQSALPLRSVSEHCDVPVVHPPISLMSDQPAFDAANHFLPPSPANLSQHCTQRNGHLKPSHLKCPKPLANSSQLGKLPKGRKAMQEEHSNEVTQRKDLKGFDSIGPTYFRAEHAMASSLAPWHSHKDSSQMKRSKVSEEVENMNPNRGSPQSNGIEASQKMGAMGGEEESRGDDAEEVKRSALASFEEEIEGMKEMAQELAQEVGWRGKESKRSMHLARYEVEKEFELLRYRLSVKEKELLKEVELHELKAEQQEKWSLEEIGEVETALSRYGEDIRRNYEEILNELEMPHFDSIMRRYGERVRMHRQTLAKIPVGGAERVWLKIPAKDMQELIGRSSVVCDSRLRTTPSAKHVSAYAN